MQLEAGGSFAAAAGVVAESSGDRMVVLHADGARMSTLSPTGALVWGRLPGTLDELVASVSEQFPDAPLDVVRTDVQRFVEEMVVAGLVVSDDAPR